jgi:hypothetical protein
MSDRLKAHTFVEMCKTETLNTCMKLVDHAGFSMSTAQKDFVLDRVMACIEQHDLEKTYDIESYILVSEGQTKAEAISEADDLFVKASDASKIFTELQTSIVGMLMDIVIGEFTAHVLKGGGRLDG